MKQTTLAPPPFAKGDRVIWFDPRLWGPRDIGNNDHCRKPATVALAYSTARDGNLVDLLFDHNSVLSRGHFADYPQGGTKVTEE